MSEELLQQETMADYEAHFDDANPWNMVVNYMEKETVLTVKIEGVVNGGVIAMVEGIRGFIPASQLSLTYVENLEDFLLQEVEVQVIEAVQAENRLILSARKLLKAKERAAKEALRASVQVGSVLKGTVDSLQSYGAFVNLENGLSGLVHVSQISDKRIKAASDVLSVGQEVEVKVIGNQNGKLSLSMKALLEPKEEEIVEEKVEIPVAENIGTSLGDLFKNIKL
jgi:small subunit ribosomal protein S1